MSDTAADSAGMSERLRRFISDEIIAEDVEVTTSTLLLNGLVDSTGIMELVAFIEEEFEISLDYRDIDTKHFRTIKDIVTLVTRKAAGE